MLAQEIAPASQAGEDRALAPDAKPIVTYSVNLPELEADSPSDLVMGNDWLRAGDVIYVSEIRRHVLTEADLNPAPRAMIGGAA